jgi:hypothetical protein
MPTPAPAPRLPIEPASRPLYRPPTRLGCSGVTLVSVAALLAFLFCLRVVAPVLTQGIADLPVPRSLIGPALTTTPTPEAGLPDAATPLPAPELTATLTPPAPPTATIPAPAQATLPPAPAATTAPAPPEYVVVANTGGTGVYLRADPRLDARRLIAVPEQTLLVIVGSDTTVDSSVWRNVRTTKDPIQTGWVPAQYLSAATAP